MRGNFLKNVIAPGLALLLFFIFSCTSRETPGTGGKAPVPAPETRLAAKEGWETNWEKTLQAAKKERRVVVYGVATVSPALKDRIKFFKEKFGLELEIASFGRGAEQMSRLLTERNSGLYLADIFMSGMNTSSSVKERGAFDFLEPALILPEVIDEKLWYKGQIPWGDKEKKIIRYWAYPTRYLSINKEFMNPEDIKSYYDLLDPRLKGKITMNDPTTTGQGFNTFSTLILHKALDLDYFRQLVRQEPLVLRDQRLQVDWLAKGKYPVALWARDPHVVEYMK